MKAATCGSIDAMYRLGIAYLYRELGLNSIPKGIKYLDKATILGHGEAAYKLSYIYEIGIDGHLNKNYYNALHYLQESADLLYIPALDKLGWIYENGKLVIIFISLNYYYNYYNTKMNYAYNIFNIYDFISEKRELLKILARHLIII